MVGIDFDFSRYVSHRRGLIEQRIRDGSAYAFSGERRIRRALASARPVLIALEAATRLWRSSGKKSLLKDAQQASDVSHPKVYLAAQLAARRLNMVSPSVFVCPGDSLPVPAAALGVDDDALVALSEIAAEKLSEAELVAAIGHELAVIQNEHTLYRTALFYLRHESFLAIRWAAGPAIVALSAWARRADITCDRAALLAVGDLQTAMTAVVKLDDLSRDADAIANLIRTADEESASGMGRYREAFRDTPDVGKRIRALRIFAETAFFRRAAGDPKATGKSPDEADVEVSALLKVFS